MLRRALPLTVLQYRRDRLLGQRVRELLRSPAATAGSAEALATLLNMSRRTLHRQLREEGVTLQAMKDEVRRERALEQLRRTDRPVKQIALDVGFRNEKSFARAFRHWTGSTPGAFRRAGGAGSAGPPGPHKAESAPAGGQAGASPDDGRHPAVQERQGRSSALPSGR